MSTSEERKEVLDSIEEDYRLDLAVHLYSSILLRRIDPRFPRAAWGSWPLPADEVPDPQTSLKYMDCLVPNDAFENDIDTDFEKIQREREKAADEFYLQKHGVLREEWRKHFKLYQKKQKKDNGEDQNEKLNDGEQDDDEDEDEEDEIDDDHDNSLDDDIFGDNDDENISEEDPDDKMLEIVDENGIRKLTKVTYTVSPSNSKADLLNEVAALIERKIAEKAPTWKKEIDENFEVAPNITNQTTKEMTKAVAGRIDRLLNSMVAKLSSILGDTADVKHQNRRLNWQHILLTGLDSMESPYDYYKPEPYAELYNKCEEMFENIDYKYEYDEEMEEEIGNDDDNGNEINEALDSQDRFDVIRYLKSLPKSDTARYQYNLKHYFEIRNRRKRYAHDLKNIYMKRLEIQKKYNQLYWNRNIRHSWVMATDSNRRLTKDLKILRENAIKHGSNNIDSNNYYLEDY